MAAKKIKFTKDWMNENPEINKRARKVHKFEQTRVSAVEDLPVLLNPKEAATILKCHYQTVRELRDDKKLQFIKRGGRYFTTPEWIADYLDTLEITN